MAKAKTPKELKEAPKKSNRVHRRRVTTRRTRALQRSGRPVQYGHPYRPATTIDPLNQPFFSGGEIMELAVRAFAEALAQALVARFIGPPSNSLSPVTNLIEAPSDPEAVIEDQETDKWWAENVKGRKNGKSKSSHRP